MNGPRRLVANHYRTGATCEFLFKDERLVSRRRISADATLVFGPGFFDLQCNGYAGVDFTHPATLPAEIANAIRAMWKRGCTHVLPTLITASISQLVDSFNRMNEAIEADEEVRRSVPGFHLEGPFISGVDGARGAHPAEHVLAPDPRLWRRLQTAARGRIRLVTLAPETEGAVPFIRQLREEGIVVALGHTMATREQIVAAVEAGAVLSTHLGNGCPQQLHRHQNPLFAQLGERHLDASLIADGIHLPPEVFRAFWDAKGPGKTLLITDAMAAADAPPGRYSLGSLLVEVGADRIVRHPGTAQLAGSALTMDAAVSNAMAMTGAPLHDAWESASKRPWKRLCNPAGARGSFVVARQTPDALKVHAVFRGNRLLYAL